VKLDSRVASTSRQAPTNRPWLQGGYLLRPSLLGCSFYRSNIANHLQTKRSESMFLTVRANLPLLGVSSISFTSLMLFLLRFHRLYLPGSSFVQRLPMPPQGLDSKTF